MVQFEGLLSLDYLNGLPGWYASERLTTLFARFHDYLRLPERMSLRILFLLAAIASVSYGSNRCKFRESRVNEQVIRVPRNCRGRVWLLGEEYWSSVGYDGRLRDGRTTNDFLTLPQSGEGQVRDGWVAFWITKDRYGAGVHYEVFGHAFLRNDGRICAWFAGRDRDAIELCEGFRVLSRNRNNPNEEMPFEWVLAGYARPRETIGFHHHRIAKYDYSPDEAFYGDANLRERTFRGVSPISRFYNELSTPDQFARKIWVLRRRPEVAAAIEAAESRTPYYPAGPRYEGRSYAQQHGQSFPRGDEARVRGYPADAQGAAQQQQPAVGSGAQSEWPPRHPAQGDVYDRQQQESSHTGDGARSEWSHTGRQDDSHARQQQESEGEARSDERESRPDWQQQQDDRRTDIEGGADSRSAAVGAGVRPEWPAPEARDQHHGHVPHSHNRGHHLQVPHDERAYPDSEVDPNAILPEPRHRQRRPDWSAAAEARGREDEVAAGVTPAAHSRDEVRVRYVKPPVIVTDQYGRRYLTKVENGETIYYADPHTQDTTAERSEQSAGEERQQTDTEGWRAVEILQPQKQVRHPGQPYDPRRAKVEEQRRAQLEERRRAQEEAQRRAQEEEQRRAQEEERRRALHQAQLDRSRQMEGRKSPRRLCRDYEARRRAHHEEYRRKLEQRRLEAQRRRAEEERRRAELIARQASEARRDYEAERSRDLPEMLDPEDPRHIAYRKVLTPEQYRQYM
ncbi:hypothetical protein Y032_0399g745 [Ancylostoma ceylanicum]|uniref:Uncharacterized protein n=1 Tax=Ancylostoma ceylanicum TaxID=53326 RepID=A0A016RR64_9BILA|nr:hypothetical protein Y032_0399g745 [Ancylostoma ceylanicum]